MPEQAFGYPQAVLPAYAGMIPNGGESIAEKVGAPRVCGDDPGEKAAFQTFMACSPRMRG